MSSPTFPKFLIKVESNCMQSKERRESFHFETAWSTYKQICMEGGYMKSSNMHMKWKWKSPPKKNISFDCFFAIFFHIYLYLATIFSPRIVVVVYLLTEKKGRRKIFSFQFTVSLLLNWLQMQYFCLHTTKTPGIFHTYSLNSRRRHNIVDKDAFNDKKKKDEEKKFFPIFLELKNSWNG